MSVLLSHPFLSSVVCSELYFPPPPHYSLDSLAHCREARPLSSRQLEYAALDALCLVTAFARMRISLETLSAALAVSPDPQQIEGAGEAPRASKVAKTTPAGLDAPHTLASLEFTIQGQRGAKSAYRGGGGGLRGERSKRGAVVVPAAFSPRPSALVLQPPSMYTAARVVVRRPPALPVSSPVLRLTTRLIRTVTRVLL